jgi:hypothetical protein
MLAAIVNSLSRHQIDASEDDTVSTATRDRGTGTAVPLSDSTLPLSTDCRSNVGRPNAAASRFDTRTRLLLDGPILATLLRLATPNVLVMFVQASVGLIETYFVAKLGTDALAGVALVFPVLMLMQMMSSGAMGGGGITSRDCPLLAYEHAIVSPGDLRRLNTAFFTLNGVISIVFFAFVAADVLVG